MSLETPNFPFEIPDDKNKAQGHIEYNKYPRMLGDDFVVKEVRRGGMGEVYICYFAHDDTDTFKTTVALKTFNKRFFFNHRIRSSFTEEVKIWMKLRDALFVMPTYGIFEYDNQVFIMMPAVTSDPLGIMPQETSLRDVLKKNQLQPEEVLTYCVQLALGMESAHQAVPGLVHGDLKPENLLMWVGMIHISDFGLSQIFSTADALLPIESTWAYQAPECWESTPTPLSDIYSFGVILFEMLLGSLPFKAESRDGWKQAHTNQSLEVPTDINRSQLGYDLITLAKSCLEKTPESRPRSFNSISQELGRLVQKYGLKKRINELIGSYSMLRLMTIIAFEEMRTKHISSLLQLSNYEEALEMLETVPKEAYTDEHWWLRGNAFSLLNRDQEALPCFEKALSMEIDDKRRWHYLSDYALSLKRIRQYDRAIEIYRHLMINAPDDFEARAIINLATVYIEQGNPRQAIILLSPFLAKNPNFAEGWANLATAHRNLGQYEDATQFLQKAISIAPNRINIQLLFVDLCMNHTGQIELAAAMLDNIYEQGHNSYDWFIRFQACNKILGRENLYEKLMLTSMTQLSKEDFLELKIKIADLVQKISSKQGENHLDVQHDSGAISPIQDQGSLDDYPLDVLQNKQPQFSQYTYHGLSLPFINTRIYVEEEMYSIDFYYPADSKEYIDALSSSLRQLSKDPSYVGLNLMMRTTPLYFTECPNCEIIILTNRDHGKELRCRACSTVHNTKVLNRSDLSLLLSEINLRMGKKLSDNKELVHILVVQTKKDDINKLITICNKYGFSQLPSFDKMIAYPLLKGVRSGVFDPRVAQIIFSQISRNAIVPSTDTNLPIITGWKILTQEEQSMYVDGMAPIVEKLLRELRVSIKGIRSVDAYFDPNDDNLESRLLRGEDDPPLIEELKIRTAENPSDTESLALLVSLLLSAKEFEEAKEKALALTYLRQDDVMALLNLGFAYRGLEELETAISVFEKVLVHEPLNLIAINMLANCFKEIGNNEQAAVYFSRAQGLGGNIMNYDSSH